MIFHSYVSLPEGIFCGTTDLNPTRDELGIGVPEMETKLTQDLSLNVINVETYNKLKYDWAGLASHFSFISFHLGLPGMREHPRLCLLRINCCLSLSSLSSQRCRPLSVTCRQKQPALAHWSEFLAAKRG